MNKLAILGGGVAGILAVVITGGAAWSGGVAQQQIEATVGKLGQTMPVKVSNARYEKGLFSSEYTLTLLPGCEAAGTEPAKGLNVKMRIHHGPLPGWTRVGKAMIETEIETPAGLRALLKDGQQLSSIVKAQTTLGLTGGSKTKLSTAKLDFLEGPNQSQVSIKEVVLDISHGSDNQVTYELNWPGMSALSIANKAAGNLEIDSFVLKGETQVDPANPVWFAVGKQEFDLKTFDVDLQAPSGKTLKMAFSKIRTTGKTTLENGLLNNTNNFRGQGSINDFQLSKLRLDTSFKRLHAATYAQILQQMFAPQSLCSAKTDAATLKAQGEATLAAMSALLTHDPELAVDNFELEIDGHAGEFSYAFGTKGLTAEEIKGPDLRSALMNKGYIKGKFEIPTVWVEKIMIDSSANRQAQDRAMLDAMLGQAVDSGYIKKEGNFLSSKFSLEGGVLQVNDKPLGPAFGR